MSGRRPRAGRRWPSAWSESCSSPDEALEKAGIAHRVLKGHAWAHTVYPDPSWRAFGDVDLLVGTDDSDRAVEVLESTGVRRTLPEVRPGFDRRFGKDATLLSASGREVDLHRLLVAGPYGLWVDERRSCSPDPRP